MTKRNPKNLTKQELSEIISKKIQRTNPKEVRKVIDAFCDRKFSLQIKTG